MVAIKSKELRKRRRIMICVMLLVATLQHGCVLLPKFQADFTFWCTENIYPLSLAQAT